MRRAVVHNPEHAVGRAIRLLAHHLFDQSVERLNTVFDNAPAEDLGELSAINRLIAADEGVQMECDILFQSGFCLGGEGPVFAFRSWQGQRDERSLQGHDSVYLTFGRSVQPRNRLGYSRKMRKDWPVMSRTH